MVATRFHLETAEHNAIVFFEGEWRLGAADDWETLQTALPSNTDKIVIDTQNLTAWDSSLAIVLLQLARWCTEHNVQLDTSSAPQGLQQLLNLAIEVPAFAVQQKPPASGFLKSFSQTLKNHWAGLRTTIIFIGEIVLASGRWSKGKAKTRRQDIAFFFGEAGPKALPIVTLISLLVGMILAYLGSVQLRQLGAQVYVADLVAIGMVREMGALMTAVIVAGRTGAAYAAQLGTMQVNEEIDALRTLGIPSMEFLVLPRLLSLVLVMPLLCIYADVIGIAGGALIATGMDVSFKQYILQTQGAVDGLDIITGIVKSLAFGLLIAVAGCQAGLQCGRSSTAVGVATTNAVVRAIVYLVTADAVFNILYDKLGI